MLEFQSVVFQYDSENFNIIDGLSFHLEKGEFVSVIARPAAANPRSSA